MQQYWKKMCDLLSEGDASLYDEVSLALEHPAAYLEKFDDALYERGIEEAEEVSPWLALVDGLACRGRLRELDWKLVASELALHLQALPACKERNITLPQVAASHEYGEALLQLAAKELAEQGLSLLCLNIEGDCYPLLVLPAKQHEEANNLAQALGQNISLILGAVDA